MTSLDTKVNLVICQKSKVNDWLDHFRKYYSTEYLIFDLTDKAEFKGFMSYLDQDDYYERIGVINYDLAFRRKELLKLHDFTLMLDESSIIQNESTKRSSFILKLNAKNVILLSGTPVNGKYENLWSQLHLLGWNISKDLFWNQYVDFYWDDSQGFPMKIVRGYKNEARLKKKLRTYGCHFLKSDDVLDLPGQIHQSIKIDVTAEYKKFRKNSIVTIDGEELVGDNTLTQMLYERQLCGQYNHSKLEAFRDLVESTNDRLIVFYNFNAELEAIKAAIDDTDTEWSFVNGNIKDLRAYEACENSITFIQYQAGAMGLNLQKANKIIYFTPPLSSELFEQSKKRTHRINQTKTCFYYYLTCKNSIEEKIFATLAMRRDYTENLFKEDLL